MAAFSFRFNSKRPIRCETAHNARTHPLKHPSNTQLHLSPPAPIVRPRGKIRERPWPVELQRRISVQNTIADAFFVPAILCYGGCVRDTFGCAGVVVAGRPTLAQLPPSICLAANGGGSTTSNDHGRSIDFPLLPRRHPRRQPSRFLPRHPSLPERSGQQCGPSFHSGAGSDGHAVHT